MLVIELFSAKHSFFWLAWLNPGTRTMYQVESSLSIQYVCKSYLQDPWGWAINVISPYRIHYSMQNVIYEIWRCNISDMLFYSLLACYTQTEASSPRHTERVEWKTTSFFSEVTVLVQN